jgi:ABC-type transport system substrate-binding protein
MKRLAILLLAALIGSANAADLRLGLALEPDSLDPHIHNFGGNKNFMPNVFESLTGIDPKDQLVPKLAVSWRLIDDLTWEFKLRDGVTFSDGGRFTARDVAFTIDRAVPHQGTVPDGARVLVGHRHRVQGARRGCRDSGLQRREGGDRHRPVPPGQLGARRQDPAGA